MVHTADITAAVIMSDKKDSLPMKIMALLLAWTVLLGSVSAKDDPPPSAAEPKPEEAYKALKHKSMPYRLLIPENYEKSKSYPLVLFFHGYGERGTDNLKQLKYDVGLFVKPDVRQKYPCFVVAPQAPDAWIPVHTPCEKPVVAPKDVPSPIATALEILNAVEKQYSVDKHRVYLSGASNGACAVWYLLERDSKRWAAAVPVCGAGDPSLIGAARHVPIWAFHGEKDRTILVERSREMIEALKAAGGTPKFTEYPRLDHAPTIKKSYTDHELLPWMFEQKRKDVK